MTEKTPIILGADTLKKILELLPQDYSVSIQINNTVFPAQTFDINEDYEEITLKWYDLDYAEGYKRINDIDDIKKIMAELLEENKQLRQQLKELSE